MQIRSMEVDLSPPDVLVLVLEGLWNRILNRMTQICSPHHDSPSFLLFFFSDFLPPLLHANPFFLLTFPACCACVSWPLSSRCFRCRFQPGDGSHRGNPHRGFFPAAGGRRRHLLLPEQVRAPHVHRREPVWEGRTRCQSERHGGGQGRLHVSPPGP